MGPTRATESSTGRTIGRSCVRITSATACEEASARPTEPKRRNASPAAIANRLGLSTQVPAKPVYLTDGRSRSVRVGNQTIRLKHVAAKQLPDEDDAASLAIQAIINAGESSLDDKAIETFRRQLSVVQRRRLLRKARYAAAWVADAARRIASSEA